MEACGRQAQRTAQRTGETLMAAKALKSIWQSCRLKSRFSGSTTHIEMNVAPNPCTSCPYRKDTPSGVWSAEEYEKLRCYDPGPHGQVSMVTALFLCHHSPYIDGETLCKGWLSVHQDGIAVRMAQMNGHCTPEQVGAEPDMPLYSSGNEAADAGQRAIKRPGKKARSMIDKLTKRSRKFARSK